jgi:outer membrane protein OmpA-like peptidoglycan-associated protein
VTDSLYSRLSSIIKPSTVTDIATQLGASDQAVSRGLALSAASAFSALASKAGDSEMMRQVIDVSSRTPANALSSITGSQLSDSASPLMSTGRRFLSSLFGGNQSWLTDLIGRESGLGSGATATVLTLGANALLNFIGGKVRDEGMTASSLSGFLRSEAPALRKMLPASFDDAFMRHFGGPEMARTLDTSPVVAQSVKKERSVFPWVAMAAILGVALWYGLRPNRIDMGMPSAPAVGTSGTYTYSPPNLGTYVPRVLVDGTTITIPERGVENQLLAFIVDTSRPVDTTTWFDFDRLLFDTGSATLRPESQAQLRDVAAILKAHPNTNVKIGGYTDNMGSSANNHALSQERADNVKTQLVKMGVNSSRLTTEGYGEEHPVGDNSTEAGRAQNRRISMLVTQK